MRQAFIAIGSSGSGVFLVQAVAHPTIGWLKVMLGTFFTLMLIGLLKSRP